MNKKTSVKDPAEKAIFKAEAEGRYGKVISLAVHNLETLCYTPVFDTLKKNKQP